MAARFELQSMGETAENVAEKWGIGREEQDAFALESHQRARRRRWRRGDFDREIVPVPIPQKKGDPVDVRARRVAAAPTRRSRRWRSSQPVVPQGRAA